VDLDRLFAELESPAPSAAGGTAAALAGAMAASLVVMVGRGSPGWQDGTEAAARAAALRDRLRELGREDVDAFGAVLHAYRARRGGETEAAALVRALLHASGVPLQIACACAEVAVLAGQAARDGKGPMRLDAHAASLLAEAAARAAAAVVRGNLRALPAGEAGEEAAALLDGASQAEELAASALAAA
jgi:formiminotetrahydrofolate cyclodeaminase